MLRFKRNPSELRKQFEEASPFSHIVIDDLFDDDVLDQAVALFPQPGEIDWVEFNNANEKKLGYRHGTKIPETLELLLYRLNSYETLQFLEELTGINGLIPDPYFGGGGLHQIVRGGYLKVHADFNWHPLLRLDRRLNMLIYLNRDWRPEYGGALELWDSEMSKKEVSILPTFNRTVIFATTDTSFHGHPQPLTCPPGMTRKSLSLYYYTNGRPESERKAPHDTVFVKPEAS